MKYQRTILLLAACAAVGACNIPDTTMENGAITMKDGIVSLHPEGNPDASINESGQLQIGDKVVTVNAAQRGLLMLYYQSVLDVNQTGKEMGRVGAKMGGEALKNKIEGKSDAQQNADAQHGGDQMKVLSQKMCQDRANIKTVQDQLSTQLAEFKPYGNIITQDSVASCQDNTKP
ncbi:hypothetical protein [Dyella mobilis]|uniref:DUF2884 family protein n=1 Tax=Dyella mobilis TaxID=1849582 RepID=A0ABS2KIA4_9GAMM|nr:hypothetical protein [Dyella mobilis]MBM7130905.1 hypothetical protein [Dyella mobilis]GLQ97534.1 hypothetical protein GCM10007863_19540 [Dyella mobilis]